MKRMKRLTVCTLAFALFALPLVACADGATSYQPPETEETFPLPEDTAKPGLPSEPSVPEAPEPPAEPEPATAKYLAVKADGLNVRTGAGTGYASLGTAERGVLLMNDGKTDGWYKTRYYGQDAYVSAAYVTPVTMPAADERTERVIEEGLRLLGTPYVYGATRYHDGKGNKLKNFSEKAFDCSSLTQYIFYRGAGVLLDVTTRTQVVQGKEIKKTDIARGDLLFFTNAIRYDYTGVNRVGHVALYLGDNYILHTATDYAKIEPISAKRWSYYLTARRF